MMLKSVLLSASRRRATSSCTRSLSTKVDKAGDTPIGADGRHELWREGIYDHDNEPK